MRSPATTQPLLNLTELVEEWRQHDEPVLELLGHSDTGDYPPPAPPLLDLDALVRRTHHVARPHE